MKQITTIRAAAVVLAIGTAGTAMAARPIMYEEAIAHQEEARIIQQPIAGINNSHWYDYRINVVETKKELASDLRRASDIEDQRDVWSEYDHELRHNRISYVKYMAKKGYRAPRVYFEGM